MGGPSRESYRAAQEALARRRAAMRTRDGVIDLAELRAARRALVFLQGLYGRMPLLVGIRLVPAVDVGFELEVTLARDDRRHRVCLPRSVNDVPVRVLVRNPGRTADGVSVPPVPSEP